MQTDLQVFKVASPVERDDAIEAEVIEPRRIRRAPSAEVKPAGAKISMSLNDWLDVDHKLWELYNRCEIAILQRDDARTESHDVELERELLAARLREWKAYARGLEKRLHQAQLDNLELTFGLKSVAEVAKEALAAPAFAQRQKRRLRERLAEIGDELG